MSNPKYSLVDKISYRLYLKNYMLAKLSYNVEKRILNNKIQDFELNQAVFITGLARAGTTVILNSLYNTHQFASLKYSNMPFLLMPNSWNRIHKSVPTPLQERAHQDGILVNNESPEALDEFFWKVFLNDSYIREGYLEVHDVSDDLLSEYIRYMKLVCISQNQHSYLSKNNNNILRLHSLLNLEINKKIILLYRHPAEHSMSLLKEHQLFSSTQVSDPFSLEYFDFIGHHEFGLHHKPFHLFSDDTIQYLNCHKENPDYWLRIWKSFYQYVLDNFSDFICVLSFDDICNRSSIVSSFLRKFLNLNSHPTIPVRPKTSSYVSSFDQSLLDECMYIYDQLNQLRKY